MKKLRFLFLVLAFLLSHAMCAAVAYAYRDMLCCIRHSLCSAPAWVAFLYAIPFGLGIIACLILARIFQKNSR